MKKLNILSVAGLLLAFNFFMEKIMHGVPGPSGFSTLVTNFMVIVFALSYLFSVLDVKNSMLRLTVLSLVFIAMVIAGIYTVMVLMGKAYYPGFMGIRLCFIEFILLLFITYLWNGRKQ
ncbi:MAG: hypothetical protein JXA66_03640 [Oligoflexia bacterium]|nr:hypothetical protein [Oligoflexia bacterium]